eukprot:9501142-Pyramimonas_sp.AAC.1
MTGKQIQDSLLVNFGFRSVDTSRPPRYVRSTGELSVALVPLSRASNTRNRSLSGLIRSRRTETESGRLPGASVIHLIGAQVARPRADTGRSRISDAAQQLALRPG